MYFLQLTPHFPFRVTTLDLLQSIYTPDVLKAIQAYGAHLESVRAHWTARANAAGQTLAEYEAAGSRDMREIVRKYTELREEVEALKAQIQRLEGEVGDCGVA